ncbi:hypothetical protein Tco_0741183 [Tanacetum coccineum]
MEEYIRLEEEKARRRSQVYNLETAIYGKIWCNEDVHDLRSIETEFPAIIFDDAFTSEVTLSYEPSPQHIDECNLKGETSLSECDEKEQNILHFNDLIPFNVIYPDDSKFDKDNDDDDKIDIKNSSRVLAERQPGIYFTVIESVFPDSLYGVSKPHGYGVLTFWTLSSLYFQHSLYDDLVKGNQQIFVEYLRSGNLAQ